MIRSLLLFFILIGLHLISFPNASAQNDLGAFEKVSTLDGQLERSKVNLDYWGRADQSLLSARSRQWVKKRMERLAADIQLRASALESAKKLLPVVTLKINFQELRKKNQQALSRAKVTADQLLNSESYWMGETYLSPFITAEYILCLKVVGQLDENTAKKAANYFLRIQKTDGSFGVWESGPSDPGVTHGAMIALQVIDTPEAVTAASHAQLWLKKTGSEKISLFTIKLMMGLMGMAPYPFNPTTLEADLAKYLPFIGLKQWASWTRALAIPLIITIGIHPKDEHPISLTHLQKSCLNDLTRWLLRITDPFGQNYISETTNILGILAYHELTVQGYGDYTAQIQGGLAFIKKRLVEEHSSELWVKNPPSVNWDTPNMLLGIMGEHPTPSRLTRYQKTIDFLYQIQIQDVHGVWSERSPRVPPGGWATVPENKINPDTDGSAQVLIALRAAGRTDANSVSQHLRAIEWLNGLQSTDGGWATFEKSHVAKQPGPPRADVPLDEVSAIRAIPDHQRISKAVKTLQFGFEMRKDMVLFMDYSFVDMTSHVIESLSEFGMVSTDRSIRRALDFLRHDLGDLPVWFSRYGIDYFAGTNAAIRAFLVSGADLSEPVIQNALNWIEAHQNSDGGFGQNFESTRDFSKAGTGKISIPTQTAHALLALVSGGRAITPAAERAAEFLIRSQTKAGRWQENEPNSWAGGIYSVQYTYLPQYLSMIALQHYDAELSRAERLFSGSSQSIGGKE